MVMNTINNQLLIIVHIMNKANASKSEDVVYSLHVLSKCVACISLQAAVLGVIRINETCLSHHHPAVHKKLKRKATIQEDVQTRTKDGLNPASLVASRTIRALKNWLRVWPSLLLSHAQQLS